MATWPTTLPSTPFQKGYEEQPPNNVIRTSMDKGPAKVRRRTTSNARPIACAMRLTAAQVEILDSFFLSDCAGGATRFDWTHPRKGGTYDFRFVEPPRYEPLSGTHWWVTVNLEQMP